MQWAVGKVMDSKNGVAAKVDIRSEMVFFSDAKFGMGAIRARCFDSLRCVVCVLFCFWVP